MKSVIVFLKSISALFIGLSLGISSAYFMYKVENVRF